MTFSRNPFRHLPGPPRKRREIRIAVTLALLAVWGALAAQVLAQTQSPPVSPPAAAAPSPAPGPLVILTQTAKNSFDLGEQIVLQAIIRNTGDSTVDLGGSAFDVSSFRLVVLDPGGAVLPLTAYGKRVLAVPKTVKSNPPVVVRAGYQRRYEFILSRMFDMSAPGVYTVTTRRVVVMRGQDTSTEVTLESDPLSITMTGNHQVQAPPATTGTPAGKWTLAFVRGGDIWTANADGTGQLMIVENGDAPAWSPDKSLLAFSRDGNIWVCDPSGGNQRRLTDWNTLQAEVHPTFSPDGKWIAYRTYTDQGGLEIRQISVDGVADKPLLLDGEQPTW
ncbi:MAG: TolB family protein [Capsulimonadaceae bacterium]